MMETAGGERKRPRPSFLGMYNRLSALFHCKKLARPFIITILLALPLIRAVPIQLSIQKGGAWTATATSPTVAGTDYSTTMYTSAVDQTTLEITRNPGGWMSGGTGWIVTVHKIDTTWNANLELWIQRTSDGTPTGNLSGGPGLNVYLHVLTATDQEFFRCASQTAVKNIDCQLEIRNVSVMTVATPSNLTTVVYTVTEY
jgi:hypothetical protein